jgi:hypothetical protein
MPILIRAVNGKPKPAALFKTATWCTLVGILTFSRSLSQPQPLIISITVRSCARCLWSSRADQQKPRCTMLGCTGPGLPTRCMSRSARNQPALPVQLQQAVLYERVLLVGGNRGASAQGATMPCRVWKLQQRHSEDEVDQVELTCCSIGSAFGVYSCDMFRRGRVWPGSVLCVGIIRAVKAHQKKRLQTEQRCDPPARWRQRLDALRWR